MYWEYSRIYLLDVNHYLPTGNVPKIISTKVQYMYTSIVVLLLHFYASYFLALFFERAEH